MKLVISILTLTIGLIAQDIALKEKPELFSRVERVIQQNEPAWRVEKVYSNFTSDPITQDIVYRSKRGQASVDISIWRREQDAKDVFGGHSIAFDNIVGKKKVKRSLPGIGDENFIWTNPNSSAWPVIRVRKGRIVVSVFAPTVTIAKKFMHHVLGQIDAIPST